MISTEEITKENQDKKFHEAMMIMVDVYYMRNLRPTVKGFLRKLDTELSEVSKIEGILDSDKLSFFEYVRAKEDEIKKRLTKFLAEFKLMYPVKLNKTK